MEELIIHYGGPGLAMISMIAATLLPFSSEAALVGAVALGISPTEAFIWASIGNCIGVIINYWMGFWGSRTVLKKLIDSRSARRAHEWSERFGKWSLLFSWLPFVGDPLTLMAGVLQISFPFFLVVACSTRVLRYGLIIAFM